ncbi:PDDEXK nuclease domain-containing protein [uncultured Alistipes sp.]|uniref:PDDEXK nuclease domain-containing protein n=1 Tax=uncultured Alistipes sp. TaxID=538949 RepID=UPI002601A6A5|nr:PDDEXK nuclease domain-containing protein [uncultured Alistipes sp.]
MESKPTFVYRDGMLSDARYVEWLSDVKTRFRQSQIKASIRVNTSMLEFYWSIGRDLVAMRAEECWGVGVVKQFALDMRQAFPDITGFSDSNVKYIKQWYSFYYERIIKSQQVVGQLEDKKGQQVVGQMKIGEKSHQLGDLLEMPELFGKVPWGQHISIVSKCQSLDEALFYIHKVADEGWSRSMLENKISIKLFQAQGSAVTNFEQTLPAPQNMLAKEILKDPYHFDFLSMKAEYDERDLEEALVANITQFLLELGKGFSFVGRQMELQMPGGQTFFPDLVFYHIPQHRYVIIELKAVKYIPEFAGKLNFYVTAADELLRGESDNPSVGLIICKSTDKTVVEWSLKDVNKPLGVATYQLEEVVDRTVAELELRAKREK